jgi:hypothetical protein
MAKCPTCQQETPLTWSGCAACVSGSHHCSTPGCECPVCPHPVVDAPPARAADSHLGRKHNAD